MKLFTKDIDDKLFEQYSKGSDLENQVVVAKIFNPYGRGTWYLLNSDPDEPDYLWAIVDLFEVEMGSASRSELESMKVPPFNQHLERDLGFKPVNALELFNYLRENKQRNRMMAKGGNIKQIPVGEEYRYKGSSSIEKEIMEKINPQLKGLRFAGNFYIKDWKEDGYLYFLDDYDRKFISDVNLKQNERIYRYFTRVTALGGMIPLVKINLENGLAYFNEKGHEDKIEFSSKGVKTDYLNLVKVEEEDYYAEGGKVYTHDIDIISKSSNDPFFMFPKPTTGKSMGVELKKGGNIDFNIQVGDLVWVDNPYWKTSTGNEKPVRRTVQNIIGDSIFFSDGSNSSVQYIKKYKTEKMDVEEIEILSSKSVADLVQTFNNANFKGVGGVHEGKKYFEIQASKFASEGIERALPKGYTLKHVGGDLYWIIQPSAIGKKVKTMANGGGVGDEVSNNLIWSSEYEVKYNKWTLFPNNRYYRRFAIPKSDSISYREIVEHGVTEEVFVTYDNNLNITISVTKEGKEYFEKTYKGKYANGGGVGSYNLDDEINQLYKKSGFISTDFNWKLKLLEMLQHQSIEAYNIYKKLSKEQKAEVLQEQFEVDNDMGSDGDGTIKTTKENLKILLNDAKNGKKYAKGSTISGFLNKAKGLGKKGIDSVKSGYGKSKNYVSKKIHDTKKKNALNVLSEMGMKANVSRQEEEKIVNPAYDLVYDKYETGGNIKLSPDEKKMIRNSYWANNDVDIAMKYVSEKIPASKHQPAREYMQTLYKKGGNITENVVAPKGYVFSKIGSHRTREKVKRTGAKYVSVWTFGGGQGSAGSSTIFLSEKDYNKIKDITGVSKSTNSLKSNSNHWFAREEDDNLRKTFNSIEQKFAKGGVTEHGLKKGDTIVDDMFWSKEAVVKDSKGKKHIVNLEEGKRMKNGGKVTPADSKKGWKHKRKS